MTDLFRLARLAADGCPPDDAAAMALAAEHDVTALTAAARRVRDAAFGDVVTLSRKVFVPLTKLCRDTCRYCTFAHAPRDAEPAYLCPEEVLAIARAGAAAGCDEVLFTLGDKPELRYRAARDALAGLGHDTTLSYLEEVAGLVLRETGLLPHINAGVMTIDDIRRLRRVSASQGLMLETTSDRLSARGGAHFGSPDKVPAVRLATIDAAGEARVPFTTGILIGIGETRAERIEALLAIRALHARHGHIQEVIVQNFRAKPGTRMANAPEPSLEDHLWTIAVARLILPADISLQAPPNLNSDAMPSLVEAGINDWGGVSPVTPDHVNPEAPWPALTRLAEATAAAGKTLAPRLTIYPRHVRALSAWTDEAIRPAVLKRSDASGHAMEDGWRVGGTARAPELPKPHTGRSQLTPILDKAARGDRLTEGDIVSLLTARGPAVQDILKVANSLCRQTNGDAVTYVVNRNLNYTNVCTYACGFCAFSKGRGHAALRGKPYDLELGEIERRIREAWNRGATEVCMQGGIHPDYTGATYLAILRAAKAAEPGIHVHAFSPLEVTQGARTLGLSIRDYLAELKSAGLGTLPGTAAEILDDEIRAIICPDKLTTAEWLSVVRTAHEVGLRTTATMMFGHVEGPEHQARHILRIRDLQAETGGFTEFVPLPFVHMEAPLALKGRARSGPSFREAVLVHAVARLALYGLIDNVQVSWVKMGRAGVIAALEGGANDLGGTLMNESISRAAGTTHGQEMPPEAMDALIRSIGRVPRIRSTLYGAPPESQVVRAYGAGPLTDLVQTPAGKRARINAAIAAE